MSHRQNETPPKGSRHLVNTPLQFLPVAEIPFAVSSLEGAVDWFLASVQRERSAIAVRLANAYCVALASTDRSYKMLLANSGINFPDGAPVVAVMRAGQQGLQARRVRGPSFFRLALERSSTTGIRHFFLGSSESTLDSLRANIQRNFPSITIAGSYSPPFAPLDSGYVSGIIDRLREEDADVIWVGMGTPKQDFIVQAIVERLGINAAGVGAAFDFVAGTTREAPKWLQHSGLEWAFRLATEPRRLGRRYLVGNVTFLRAVSKQLVSGVVATRLKKRSPVYGSRENRRASRG